MTHLNAAKKPDWASMLLERYCLTAASRGAAAPLLYAQPAAAAAATRPLASHGKTLDLRQGMFFQSGFVGEPLKPSSGHK
jgi:hypothetical protein